MIGSTGDDAFPASCSETALEQGLRTDNLAISRDQETLPSLEPVSVEKRQVPDGYAYTVSTYHDPDGCLIAEKTIVEGMPHVWSGGLTGRGDVKGPNGAEIAWTFFSRFTRSLTSMPCAEIQEPAIESSESGNGTRDVGSDGAEAAEVGRVRNGATDARSNRTPIIIIGLVAVLLLAVGGVVLVRRRSRSSGSDLPA